MPRRRLNPDGPALTGAERQRRYRAKLRKAGLVERWVSKDAANRVPAEIERQIFGDEPDGAVRLPDEVRHSDETPELDELAHDEPRPRFIH